MTPSSSLRSLLVSCLSQRVSGPSIQAHSGLLRRYNRGSVIFGRNSDHKLAREWLIRLFAYPGAILQILVDYGLEGRLELGNGSTIERNHILCVYHAARKNPVILVVAHDGLVTLVLHCAIRACVRKSRTALT